MSVGIENHSSFRGISDAVVAAWSGSALAPNFLVVLSVAVALLLGLLVGYERAYRGRAAGMRTYALVCMASAALTSVAGYPDHWFGMQTSVGLTADPTRIIQGIVTGVGFLGAGVIMKEGLNISGLTTAASIWAVAVIGVLVGVGFHLSAILLTVLSALCMVWVPRIAAWLPSRQAISVVLCFRPGFSPREESLRDAALQRGYEIAGGSIAIHARNGSTEWHFVAVALNKTSGAPLSELARELGQIEGVDSFHLAHARN